jgi:hypothetical protein
MQVSKTLSKTRRSAVAILAVLTTMALAGAALADEVGVSSSSSKLSCHNVSETQCTADPHGNISGCHTVQVKECTVVGGVGAAQLTTQPGFGSRGQGLNFGARPNRVASSFSMSFAPHHRR